MSARAINDGTHNPHKTTVVSSTGKKRYQEYQPRHDTRVLPIHHPARKYFNTQDASRFIKYVYSITVSPKTIRNWIRDGVPDPHDPEGKRWMQLRASSMTRVGVKYFVKREKLVCWMEHMLLDSRDPLVVQKEAHRIATERGGKTDNATATYKKIREDRKAEMLKLGQSDSLPGERLG